MIGLEVGLKVHLAVLVRLMKVGSTHSLCDAIEGLMVRRCIDFDGLIAAGMVIGVDFCLTRNITLLFE